MEKIGQKPTHNELVYIQKNLAPLTNLPTKILGVSKRVEKKGFLIKNYSTFIIAQNVQKTTTHEWKGAQPKEIIMR